MRRCMMHGIALAAVLPLIAAGCGKQASDGPSATNEAAQSAQLEGPAAAAAAFLEAIRTGNEKAAMAMLSTLARQKNASLDSSVTPSASDTAKFVIGKVDYLGDDGARVACKWSDLDSDGQMKTDEAVWVLRRETEGWRIIGLAIELFPGEMPLVLKFEDPEDMKRKKQWAHEEMRRRMEKEDSNLAKTPENPENPVQR
jgi:hypothetical protein